MKLTKEEYKQLMQWARRLANRAKENASAISESKRISEIARNRECSRLARESDRWHEIADALESGEVS